MAYVLGPVIGEIGGGGQPMEVTVIDGPVVEQISIPIEIDAPTLVTVVITKDCSAGIMAGDEIVSVASQDDVVSPYDNAAAAVLGASATLIIGDIPPGGSVSIYKQEVPE